MFLWDNDAQLIDCNEAAIRILKAESKEWLLSRRTTGTWGPAEDENEMAWHGL